MPKWMTSSVWMMLLMALALLADLGESRPSPAQTDYFLTQDDVSSQIRHPTAKDVNDAMSLLAFLVSTYRQKQPRSDVMSTDSDANEDVITRLVKRNRMCFWNIVSCY